MDKDYKNFVERMGSFDMEIDVPEEAKEQELTHYGVLGMKWGVRRRRVTGGYLTRSRQLKADKLNLERMNKGKHLSVGITKKRQAAYDKRDRGILETRIKRNEDILNKRASNKLERKETKKRVNALRKQANKESKIDRLVYDKATYRKVDKLMQKKGMNKADAIKKAKGEAWTNTAIAAAGYIAYKSLKR